MSKQRNQGNMTRRSFIQASTAAGITGCLTQGERLEAGLFNAQEAQDNKAAPARPVVGGIHPHLACVSTESSEDGIGAVVPWAGSLWYVTYPAHRHTGTPEGGLYQVDKGLNLTRRVETVGGTHACRMIHRESKQLIIGPYFIDAQGKIRSVQGIKDRLTAVMRHLTDPANKVYFYGMEGLLVEVNVHTLEWKQLFQCPAPGGHGKGGYTGQNVVVVANNGSVARKPQWQNPGGCGGLAEWDGKAWKVIAEDQGMEVTGPGGLDGTDDPKAPIWATGWDKRSAILRVRHQGSWHVFRLPKTSYCYDGAHGWFTEWFRIREIEPGRLLLDLHGLFYDFPKGFRPGQTGGLKPISAHLRMYPDFCHWNGQVVLAADDNGIANVEKNGQPQSNLTFLAPGDLKNFGEPYGFGGVWVQDEVKARVPSDPFLAAGFAQRLLHVTQQGKEKVEFAIEIDQAGDGKWTSYRTLTVEPGGYVFHVFPAGFQAQWVRLIPSADCNATAYFHYTRRQATADGRGGLPETLKMFEGLAALGDKPDHIRSGLLLPATRGEWTRPRENQLWLLAGRQADVKAASQLFSIDDGLRFHTMPKAQQQAEAVAKRATLSDQLSGDAASVVVMEGGRRWRLPRSSQAFAGLEASTRARAIRPVVTERSLMNRGGLFYRLPWTMPINGLGTVPGFAGLTPISAHDKLVHDFCSWRGLLVMSGTRAGSRPDGHLFADAQAGASLWFGNTEDLWLLGKPRGQGGPWLDTPVKPKTPSDPYLMTGFDRKLVKLKHNDAAAVSFQIEVNFLPTPNVWKLYATITVPAGQETTHRFPDGFSAHWVRVIASKECNATAWFVYE